MLTKQDLFDCVKGHPKAREAIFWWCHAWQLGVESDLYRILCDVAESFTPNPKDTVMVPDLKGGTREEPRWYSDPEIIECFNKLDQAFPTLADPARAEFAKYEYSPVMLRDVREGHVLVAGSEHFCLINRWPCRVYRDHGTLGVTCMEHAHGIKLLTGSSHYFHQLTEDANGHVKGFAR